MSADTYRVSLNRITIRGETPASRKSFLGAFSFSEAARIIFLGFLGLVAVSALLAYIFSVNAIILDGKAIHDQMIRLRALEEANADLEAQVAALLSPASLEAASAELGLVAVDAVRFIDLQKTFALSNVPSNGGTR